MDTSMFNGALSRGNISGKILNDIRKDILTKQYQPGTKLTEMFLCQKYGISRQPARAIMQQLEKEGHLSMLSSGSKITVDFTKKDLNDLYSLRNYLELSAVESFLNSESPNILPLIQALQETERLKIGADTLEKDILFHRAIIETSGNRYSVLTYDNISSTLYSVFALSIATDPKDFFEKYKERHASLIRAMLNGEREGCLNAFRAHHEYALQKAISIMESV